MGNAVNLFSTPHFRLEGEIHTEAVIVRPIGLINEDASLTVVLNFLQQLECSGRPVRFDLGQVLRMNSCGLREWLLMLERLPPVPVEYENVSEVSVEYANTIRSIFGKGGPWGSSSAGGRSAILIRSFHAPYYCDACDTDVTVVMEPAQVRFNQGIPVVPEMKCGQCTRRLQFDSIPGEYFDFVRRIAA